jgi:hypothetical protein
MDPFKKLSKAYGRSIDQNDHIIRQRILENKDWWGIVTTPEAAAMELVNERQDYEDQMDSISDEYAENRPCDFGGRLPRLLRS